MWFRKKRAKTELYIVTEEGRPYFYAPWLEWAEKCAPELRSRIRLGYLPGQISRDTTVLHAWVQDPVLERNEAVFRQLEMLEGQARRLGVDIVHPARVLSNSRRDVMCERLTHAGIRTPRIVDIGPQFLDSFGGFEPPLIVRKSWGHIKPMMRLDTEADVVSWFETEQPIIGEWVAAEYIDYQDPDGLYRKYRYILFGDRGVTRHLVTSTGWEVRNNARLLNESTKEEELRFLGEPFDWHDLFDRGRRELEFDIAAFDYSFDQDGGMVVWEVNPYPDIKLPAGEAGDHLADSTERTYRALAEFYTDRLEAQRS